MRIEKLKYLDETDKKILELITQGKTYKQISFTVGMKSFAVAHRIRVLKKHFRCESVPHLIASLSEANHI